MKRTKFKRTRIQIGDDIEFIGSEYYNDTGAVVDIRPPGNHPNRLIQVQWNHEEGRMHFGGIYGVVAENDLRRIQKL